MSVPLLITGTDMLQEREIEKVNFFYLQKEAEVSTAQLRQMISILMFNSSRCA